MGGDVKIGDDKKARILAATEIRERAQRIRAAVAEPHRFLQRSRCSSIGVEAHARSVDERDGGRRSLSLSSPRLFFFAKKCCRLTGWAVRCK